MWTKMCRTTVLLVLTSTSATDQTIRILFNLGFKLKSDGLECEDINECVEEYGVCSQHCQNTVGSFECSCADDYFMYGTSTCKAKGNFDPILFFSGKSEVRLIK